MVLSQKAQSFQYYRNIKGAVYLKHQFFTALFVLFVVFIYMSAGCVSTFRTCVQVYLEICPNLLLILISRFVIDFLSIRKVIIFSAITTDDRHPLRSRSIHQNAANYMMIRFRYIYCAKRTLSHNDVRPLTSWSNGKPSKKTMESLEDICSCRNCSKARPHVSR